MEDKEKFVALLNNALIECGGSRCLRYRQTPMSYYVENGRELVECGATRVNVTGDSLPALLRDLMRGNII